MRTHYDMYVTSVAVRFMFHRLLCILQVWTIVACPLVCTIGHGTTRAADEASASCCACCKTSGEPVSSDEPACPPHDSSTGSGTCCHCVCGGALVADVTLCDTLSDSNWSLAASLEGVDGASLHAFRLSPFCAASWPNIGMNPGRALCCLFNTYLC
jgi:hypothetical protein